MSQRIIILKNISKKYDLISRTKRKVLSRFKHEDFFALKNINLSIEKGKTVGIIGPNGGGKTTLLKIISKIISPTSGKVNVNGKDIPFLEIGVGFHEELTARENIFLQGIIMGLSKKQLTKEMEDILKFAGVKKFADMELKKFSSGMKVRLAFSILMRTKADIFLFDEIFAVGDEEFRKKTIKIFKKMKNENKTIIIASHNLAAIKLYCDELIFLHKGKLIAQGDPEEVIKIYNRKKYE